MRSRENWRWSSRGNLICRSERCYGILGKEIRKFNVSFTKTERFGEQYLAFDDPHGLHLEIVEREEGENNTWNFGEVTSEVAIKGFGGATLLSTQPEKTAELLEKVMGLELIGEEGDLVRFRSSAEIGNIIDLKLTPDGLWTNGGRYCTPYCMESK